MKKHKKILLSIIATLLICSITGCAYFDNLLSEIKGDLIGNNYTIYTYDNYGERNLLMHGDKISIEGNPVEESGYDSSGNVITTYSLSSVITITIDGHEVESCGDTMIFAGDGLEPIVNFSLENIDSDSGVLGLTSINRVLNDYENLFGKGRIVVIKSQMGVPICAFEGEEVYWEIPEDLPKMTKLMVDGKPLYIHRANYQIIDKELLEQ